MNYIHITKENLDKEHICCAMSGKQSLAKKEWLRQRFDEGLVFYRSEERGKCFIEYIPAENAWVPIEADGISLYQLPVDRRRDEGARIFERPFERVHPGGQSAGKERASASCAPRDGSGNFSLTRNFWPTRASGLQTSPTAGSA